MSKGFLNKRTAVVAAAMGVAVVAMVIAFDKCSGTQKQPPAQDAQLTVEQSAAKILSEHAVYDGQTLQEYAMAIEQGKEFTAEDFSLMIVGVEAALDRVNQELEYLIANDDMADSWETLRGYSAESWPADCRAIAAFLESGAPLNDEQRSRADKIMETMRRTADMVSQIERTQLDGESTGLVILN